MRDQGRVNGGEISGLAGPASRSLDVEYWRHQHHVLWSGLRCPEPAGAGWGQAAPESKIRPESGPAGEVVPVAPTLRLRRSFARPTMV